MSLGLQVRRVPQVQGHHWFGDPVVMGGWRKSSQLLLGKKVVIATLWNIKNRKKSATVRLVRSKYFNQLFTAYFKRRHWRYMRFLSCATWTCKKEVRIFSASLSTAEYKTHDLNLARIESTLRLWWFFPLNKKHVHCIFTCYDTRGSKFPDVFRSYSSSQGVQGHSGADLDMLCQSGHQNFLKRGHDRTWYDTAGDRAWVLKIWHLRCLFAFAIVLRRDSPTSWHLILISFWSPSSWLWIQKHQSIQGAVHDCQGRWPVKSAKIVLGLLRYAACCI